MTAPRSQRERRRRLLAALAEVPDPLRSHEEWIRHRHLDLPHLPLSRLLFERDQLRTLFLLFDDAMDPWYADRLRAVEARLRDAR